MKTKFSGKFHKLFDWLAYNARLALLVTILQVIAGVLGFKLTQETNPFWEVVYRYGFIVAQVLVLLVLTGRFFSLCRRAAIVFRLQPDTGVLKDQIAGFTNVSLRKKSWEKMMGCFYRETSKKTSVEEAQHIIDQAGFEVGFDFANEITGYWKNKNQQPSEKESIALWFKYDSSSGMGRFTLEKWSPISPISFIFRVLNPFTYDLEGGEQFFLGYSKGVVTRLLNRDAKVTLQQQQEVEAGDFYRLCVECMAPQQIATGERSPSEI